MGVVEGIGLMLRSRTIAVPRAVLVLDDAITAWWDALVATDARAAATWIAAALARAAADARPTERYRLLEGDRLVPSVRARRPALRDDSPPTLGRGRWVGYAPRDDA
ncbi:hypothetical protein [Clavibacter californiensis]|nr:hypothetical protein [Clavibacter californiensis]UKF80316.1 hypothetical protein FGD68_01280 [Clavibacter californiensis]